MEANIFYTNVDRLGNKILFRGYKNGKRFVDKITYKPTFHVTSNSDENGWKTLADKPVAKIKPGTMRDCKDFLAQYDDVRGFNVYGTTNYIHQFISDYFPDTIKYDRTKMNICTIDIEVASGKYRYEDTHEVKVRRKK